MSTDEMAAQFAIGFFPVTQGFSGRGQPGGQAKRVKQPVGRQSPEIPAIRLSRRTECAGSKPDVLHRKRNCPDRHNLAVCLDRGPSGLVERLGRQCEWMFGSQDRCAGTSGSCYKFTTIYLLHRKLLCGRDRSSRICSLSEKQTFLLKKGIT